MHALKKCLQRQRIAFQWKNFSVFFSQTIFTLFTIYFFLFVWMINSLQNATFRDKLNPKWSTHLDSFYFKVLALTQHEKRYVCTVQWTREPQKIDKKHIRNDYSVIMWHQYWWAGGRINTEAQNFYYLA